MFVAVKVESHRGEVMTKEKMVKVSLSVLEISVTHGSNRAQINIDEIDISGDPAAAVETLNLILIKAVEESAANL